MQVHYLTAQEAEEMRNSALFVQDAMVLSSPARRPFQYEVMHVLLWCDLEQRPDVRDSIRVHATDGDGLVDLTWKVLDPQEPLTSAFFLEVIMHRPVQLTFTIGMDVENWSLLPDTLASAGTCILLPGPPLNWRELASAMSIEQLLDEIYQHHGAGLLIDFRGGGQKGLLRLYGLWKRALFALFRKQRSR
jgi:hypothetical protein